MTDVSHSRFKMSVLTRANYRTWSVQAKDYILAIYHDDAVEIWNIFEWTQAAHPGENDPIDRDFQAVTSVILKKLRVLHNKAFAHLIQHMSHAIFITTTRLPHSVPVLLRHLRTYWHAHSPLDRAALTKEFRAMRLSHYEDMQAYVAAFENMVYTLKEYKIGGVEADEDVIFQFEEGLPDAWSSQVSIRNGYTPAHTLEIALAWYCSEARSHRNNKMPGAPVATAHRSTTDSAFATGQGQANPAGQDRTFATVEVCRNFAKGKCTRANGTCRFFHPPTPGGHPPQTAARGSARPKTATARSAVYCVYCRQSDDHMIDACPQLKAKKERLARHDATHATVDHTNVGLPTAIDDMAWATGHSSHY